MGSIEDGPLQSLGCARDKKAGPTTEYRKKKQIPNPADNAGFGMTSVVARGGFGMKAL